MIKQKIYFKKARNFGEVFSASFGYIKQNFKSFYGSIILFTVPFVALMTLIAAYLVSNATSGISLARLGGSEFIESIFLVIFILFIFLMIIQTVYVTVINEHLVINEQLPNDEFVKTNQIGKRFFGSFWRVLGNGLLLGILGFVFLLLYALINSLITAAFASTGVGGAIFAALLQMATSFLLSPIVGYIFISSIFVVQRDKVGLITALRKVFHYLRGNFWTTWSVSFTGYLLTYICSGLASIPAIIFVVLAAVSKVKYTMESSEVSNATIITGAIIFMLTIALIMCVYSIYFLMCNFQYTSLEEKKEGSAIIDKINQIQ